MRLLILTLCLFTLSCQPPAAPPNVLFIAIDDLRPQLGVSGFEFMHTPNLDRVAEEGRYFARHYVQAPTCGASRYSMLTGIRPHLPEHLNNNAFRNLMPREEQEEPESVAHLFRRNGYYTAAIGKISHMPDSKLYTYEGEGDGAPEMPFSWDEATGPVGKWKTGWNAFFGYSDGTNRNMERGAYPAYERVAVADTSLPDGVIAMDAVNKLRELKDQPFFLAVGFFKPHLPFTAPAKYWELYDEMDLDISPNPEAPEGVTEASLHASSEMFRNYGHDAPIGGAGVRVSDDHARTLRHAYYASVSYVDAQVGKVLDELEALGLSDNTIVVVWGDHGWHLGDHTIWGKHTAFERSLKSVLMIRAPGLQQPGVPAEGLVESLDIYPTLAELAGLEAPEGLTGSSLVPILQDPGHPGKDGAFGYWRGRRTLRTDRYRITEYEDGAVELYDHAEDPNETRNVAGENREVVQELLGRLREGVSTMGVPAMEMPTMGS